MCDIPQGSIHNLPRGWAMMILRGMGAGHSFSLLWFRGGCGKFPTKITSSIGGGGQPFFSWERKGSENMLLDALIIPVFYFILTKCWYRTRVWNLMLGFSKIRCGFLTLRMTTPVPIQIAKFIISQSFKQLFSRMSKIQQFWIKNAWRFNCTEHYIFINWHLEISPFH